MYGKLDYLAIVPPTAQKAVSDTPVLWTQLYINVTHNMLSVYNFNCQYFVKIKICLHDVSAIFQLYTHSNSITVVTFSALKSCEPCHK